MWSLISFVLILFSSFATIFATNVVYGVLQLIMTYTLVGFRLIFVDLEFFSTVFIVVCAGGMGVLFLFVIMTFSKKAPLPFFQLPYYKQFFFFVLFYFSGLYFWYSFQYYILFMYDFSFLYDGEIVNYTYVELFSNLLSTLGYHIYFQYPFFIYGGGLFLFFALIAAVYLTAKRITFIKAVSF